ncbi:MAG TPA: MFS transporter, partial [Azonexus sp.]|nr:MFS transporter [Azonexus sp.]
GPLVAAALLAGGMGLREVFLWSLVPAILCLLLALALREPEHEAAASSAPFDWRLADMPPAFRRYLAVVALFTLGNSSNMFLLLRARELGVGEAEIPLLWAAVSAVAAVFSTPLAALSDRFGRLRLLLGGYLAYGIFYVTFGSLATDGFWLFVLFAFYGLFMAATEGVEKALVADLAPNGRRGTAFGWFNLTTGLMLLPASIVFGWLWQGVASWLAFLFSACCAFAAAGLLKFWVFRAEAG